MSYKLKSIEAANPNQMPTGLVRPINRFLGRFGLFLVDDEKPQILNIELVAENDWATVNFGNPVTGEITHQLEVPRGRRYHQQTSESDIK